MAILLTARREASQQRTSLALRGGKQGVRALTWLRETAHGPKAVIWLRLAMQTSEGWSGSGVLGACELRL